jgi:hypothetical protein
VGGASSASIVAGVAFFIGVGAAISAEKKPSPKSDTQNAPQQQAPQADGRSQQQVVMPDAEKIVLLLRNTLITLNDAIQTGNFTVLRDRGAPGFRETNSAARLSRAFSDLSSKGVDLSAVSIIAPQLTEAPTLDQQKGMLHLKGFFPGQPVQINFEMLYQAVEGGWQLFGLSVQPTATLSQTTGAQDNGSKN